MAIMPDPQETPLSPRTRVRGDSPDSFDGRLGLLVYDSSVNRVVSLTSAQLVRTASSLHDGRRCVAVASHNVFPPPDPVPHIRAESLIVPVVVPPARPLALDQFLAVDGDRIYQPDLQLNAKKLLGEEVLIQVDERRPTRAVLNSLNGQFLMPLRPGEEFTFVEGALEMSAPSGDALTRAGDAGAVVTSLAGHPIGVVICGIDGTTFAAPTAGAILAVGDCAALDQASIGQWNDFVLRRDDAPTQAVGHRPAVGDADWIDRNRWDDIAERDDDDAILHWSRAALDECF
jgi:hypothetical protein